MSYWYEVIAPIPDGADDFAYEVLAEFESMIKAIEYAKRHEDARLYMVLNDISGMDMVELPLK